jgi:hypothetical protein
MRDNARDDMHNTSERHMKVLVCNAWATARREARTRARAGGTQGRRGGGGGVYRHFLGVDTIRRNPDNVLRVSKCGYNSGTGKVTSVALQQRDSGLSLATCTGQELIAPGWLRRSPPRRGRTYWAAVPVLSHWGYRAGAELGLAARAEPLELAALGCRAGADRAGGNEEGRNGRGLTIASS